VVASNSDSLWNGSETALQFEIEPLFWQTRWFRITCVALILLSVWSVHRYRLYHLTKQFNLRLAERARLHQLEAELAHINRVNMMGELAASLAHEIRQPIAAAMTSANACLRWLVRDPPDLERARAAAMRVEQDGNRAADVISRLRSFYKKGPRPEREMVDVNEIVREMIVLLRDEGR
jgi:C4-dicarboxylate-specific signal transduction histidine kinase